MNPSFVTIIGVTNKGSGKNRLFVMTIEQTANSGSESIDSGEKSTNEEVSASFLACARCSYFLSGYRLIHDDFNQAVENSTKGWLTLTGDHKTRLLVHESFGSALSRDAEYLESVCPECWRRYIFEVKNGEPAEFRIKIKPS